MSAHVVSRVAERALGGPSRKVLMLVMGDYASRDGSGVYCSVSTLAKETELSDRTVQRLLQEFLDEGLIEQTGQRPVTPPYVGFTKEYRIVLDVLERLPIVSLREGKPGDALSPGDKSSPGVAMSPGEASTAASDGNEKRTAQHLGVTPSHPVKPRHPNLNKKDSSSFTGEAWANEFALSEADFAIAHGVGLDREAAMAAATTHVEFIRANMGEQSRALAGWALLLHEQFKRVGSKAPKTAPKKSAAAPSPGVALPNGPTWWTDLAPKIAAVFTPDQCRSYWFQCAPVSKNVLKAPNGVCADWCEKHADIVEDATGVTLTILRAGSALQKKG